MASQQDRAIALEHGIHSVKYEAKAALLMLESYPGFDADEALTGVSYLLQAITRECTSLADIAGGAELSADS